MGAFFHRWGRFLFCGRVNISLQFDSKDRESLLNKVLKKKKRQFCHQGDLKEARVGRHQQAPAETSRLSGQAGEAAGEGSGVGHCGGGQREGTAVFEQG